MLRRRQWFEPIAAARMNDMSIRVRIPSPLRGYTNGADVVESPGANVGEVLNVYLNDEDIRFLKNLDTPVKDGDEISIVPAIAGG